LPSIKKFAFEKDDEKMLTGTYSKEKTSVTGAPVILDQDCFGDFGIVSLWYQNSAYTDGRYNNSNYKVEKGTLAGKTAFKVYPHEKKFTEFLASEHAVIFKLPEKTDYRLYSFANNSLSIAQEMPEEKVSKGNFNIFLNVKISTLGTPMIYFV
jgi:hypothetical protein